MVAARPLVLESSSSVFLFFVFYNTNFFLQSEIFKFNHNFYHKCLPQILLQILPQTTIIIGVSISTTRPIFVPIQQFFNVTKNVTTHFYHIFYHKCYHKLLPQTTIIIGEAISTTTPIFVPINIF